MYGWMIGSIESYILKVHGVETWEKILKVSKCGIGMGEFHTDLHYSDNVAMDILNAAATQLKMELEELILSLGMNFVHYLDENGFYSTIRYQGSTFAEWIDNINEPHRLLRGKFPKGSLPEFWTQPDDTDPTGKSILVHFYSKRGKLFAPYTKGIIIEAARVYFSLDVTLILINEDWEGECYHAIWRIPAPSPISPKRRTVSFDFNPPDIECTTRITLPHVNQHQHQSQHRVNNSLKTPSEDEIHSSVKEARTSCPFARMSFRHQQEEDEQKPIIKDTQEQETMM
jgi:hypothetical protein